MSGKNAKAERKKIVHHLSMTYSGDGKVKVSGIPADPDVAAAMLADMFKCFIKWYVDAAKAARTNVVPISKN